jgi:hypothetical protein
MPDRHGHAERGVTYPGLVVLALDDRRAEGGRLIADHDAASADLRAALAVRGVRSVQHVDRRIATLPALAADVGRHGAPWVAIAAAGGAVAAAAARALAARDDGPRVVVLGEEHDDDWPAGAPRVAAGDAESLAGLLGATASPAERDPSAWLLELLPARAAARVGVRLAPLGGPADGLALGRVRAELRWLERRTPIAQLVPLRGAAPARELAGALGDLGLRYIRPTATLDARAAHVEAARALAEAGVAELTLTVDVEAGDAPEAIRRVRELAAAAAPARSRLHLRLAGDPAADEAAVAAAAAFPGFTYEGDAEGFVAPELQASRTFQARAGVLGAGPARLRRALEGAYPDAPRLAAHPIDVLWRHPDDPGRHGDWLAGLLAADSALFVLNADAAGRPPAPLRAVHRVIVEDASAAGATWRVEGETWHVRPYAAARSGEPLRPLVLTVARREDLDALLADADAAHAGGVLGHAIAHPAVTVADLARWAGPGEDPGPRLARLVIDGDGLVRPAAAAAPLGELGEPFAALRARAARRLAELDERLPADAWPCLSLPAWLDPDEAAALQAARPWLATYALVPRALRALARKTPAQGAEVRVGGLGGPLLYDGERDPSRSPSRRLLVRVGDRHAIYDPRTDAALLVGSDLAALWEGLVACGDPRRVAEWLAGARGLDASAAARAVTVAAGRLRAAGALVATEVRAAEPAVIPA